MKEEVQCPICQHRHPLEKECCTLCGWRTVRAPMRPDPTKAEEVGVSCSGCLLALVLSVVGWAGFLFAARWVIERLIEHWPF